MADPTEEIIKREIAKAREILKSDRHSSELKGLRERFDKHYPDNSDPGDDGNPKPPPPQPPADPAPKKHSIWWGEEK